MHSQIQISKDADYIPYTYNPFLGEYLELIPLKKLRKSITDFAPEPWKWSILDFIFSLFPCSWLNNPVLMTNYSKQKKKKKWHEM